MSDRDDDDIIDAEVVSFGPPGAPSAPNIVEPKSLPSDPAANGKGPGGPPGPPLCELWQMLRKSLGSTYRETQVLRGLYHGEKHAAIALALTMSKHTVSIHWRHVRQNAKIANRTELISRINEILTQRRIDEAVEAATRPLREEIEALYERLRETSA